MTCIYSGGFLLIVPIVSMIFFLRVAALYGNNRKCEAQYRQRGLDLNIELIAFATVTSERCASGSLSRWARSRLFGCLCSYGEGLLFSQRNSRYV